MVTDYEILLARIGRVENDNRRIKLAIVATFLLSAVILAFMASGLLRGKQALEAQELLLKDSSGHIVARLGSGPVGACLEILGKTKESSATLCAGDDSGSSLFLAAHHGDSRALVSAGGLIYETPNGNTSPSLMISEGGKDLISLTVGRGQAIGIPQNDRQASPAMYVIGEKPAVSLLKPNGTSIWTAP
jgi:hypothetical protein